MENTPDYWISHLPRPDTGSHKYRRGHALVIGGQMPGATRLVALAALRAGAGMVTLLSPPENHAINATALTSVIVRPLDEMDDYLADVRVTAIVFGPGAGVSEDTRKLALRLLNTGKALVLDADALTSFADEPESLYSALHGNVLLTPHSGEFARLFGDTGSKEEATLQAARRCGTVVLHKGAQTVIASPDARVCINTHASPWLATAGTGDVLAGISAGLLAQGMPVFEAACAAAWMHGDAARRFGPGLIADDLPGMLPQVWQGLL